MFEDLRSEDDKNHRSTGNFLFLIVSICSRMASSTNRGSRVRSSNSRKALLPPKDLGVTGTDFNVETSHPRLYEVLLENQTRTSILNHRRNKNSRKKKMEDDSDVDEVKDEKIISIGCLKLLLRKGGGCKVSSCEELEVASNSNTIRKRGAVKEKEMEPPLRSCQTKFQFSLPDDVLEMCLVRLPFSSLMAARLVCKKWRSLTMTSHFTHTRSEGLHETPWLFLFGIIRSNSSISEIHALDVSLDRWHTVNADVLQGRFLFSVAGIKNNLYVVGGRSSLNNSQRERVPVKTHKDVFVFSPISGLWSKAAPMKSARSSPVLGVFKFGKCCTIFHDQTDLQEETRVQRSRINGVSDVYEDPHKCSVRRQLRDIFSDKELASEKKKSSSNPVTNTEKIFGLIVVGGLGSWDEPLDSGEVYDVKNNRWMTIPKLPADFGPACSGAVCRGVFYVYSESDRLAGYNLELGRWVSIQTHYTPPRLQEYDPRLVCCNDRLLLLTASWLNSDRWIQRGGKVARKVWELSLTPLSWTDISTHPDAPMDRDAAFVADRDRIYGVEMFKIFGQVLDFLTVCDVLEERETKWSRLSNHHASLESDLSSCVAKRLVVLHL